MKDKVFHLPIGWKNVLRWLLFGPPKHKNEIPHCSCGHELNKDLVCPACGITRNQQYTIWMSGNGKSQ